MKNNTKFAKKLYLIIILLSGIITTSCSSTKSHYTSNINTPEEERVGIKKQYQEVILTQGNFISRPCIVGSNLYILDSEGFVLAFSLSEKKMLWKTKVTSDLEKNDLITGGIQYSNGKLYINNGSKFIFVFDALHGYELIRKLFSDLVLQEVLVIDDDKILIQSSDGKILLYDFTTMSLVWEFNEKLKKVHKIFDNNVILSTDHYIVTTVDGTSLLCLDKFSGNKIFDLNLYNDNNQLFVTNRENFIHDVDKMIFEDFLFVLMSNGDLLKINIPSGNIIFNKNFPHALSFDKIENKILLLQSSSLLTINVSEIEKIKEFTLDKTLSIKDSLQFLIKNSITQANQEYHYVLTKLGNILQLSDVKKSPAVIHRINSEKSFNFGMIYENYLIFISNKSLFF